MRVAIMQPYFFPYLGYFQLIKSSDVFIIYDDVKYRKGGWINRNQIINNQKKSYITVSLSKPSPNKLIYETYISKTNDWRSKILNSIKEAYSKFDNFSHVYPIIEDIVLSDCEDISELASLTFIRISEYLSLKNSAGVAPRFVLSSSLENDKTLRGQEKVIDICNLFSATEYVNMPGGRALYDSSDFNNHNIDLYFLNPNLPNDSYYISIVDVLMRHSIKEINELIDNVIVEK